MAGYDNNLVVPNLGSLFYALLGLISFGMIHLILYILSKIWTKVVKTRDWASKYLYFNGSIRFVMESFMDMVLFSLINLKDADWSGNFAMVTFCNYCSIFLLVFCIGFPIGISVIYILNLKRWDEEAFKDRYGSLINGAS